MNKLTEKDMDTMKIYMEKINQYQLLKYQEEKQLLKKAYDGDIESSNKIVLSNLRLIISISKKYFNLGLSLEDMIQEGIIGLIEAINNFDISKNIKFSTYATIFVEKYIKSAIIKNNNLHQNPKTYYKIVKIKKIYQKLYNQLERKPTLDEIAHYTNTKKEYIEELLSYSYDYTSLYSAIKTESKEILLDFIVDHNKSVEEIVVDEELKEYINYLLFESNLLDEKEQYIFINRFGFKDKIMSYDEIGEKLNISGEAIRQRIVKTIIHILKEEGEKLAEFTSNPNKAKEIIENAKNNKFKINSFKAKNRKKTIN